MNDKHDYYENVIEWLDGDDTISVTVHQKKYVNKIKKLAKNLDNNVQILSENDDGSIFAHVPLSCLKLYPKPQRALDAARKSELAERMRNIRKNRLEAM